MACIEEYDWGVANEDGLPVIPGAIVFFISSADADKAVAGGADLYHSCCQQYPLLFAFRLQRVPFCVVALHWPE